MKRILLDSERQDMKKRMWFVRVIALVIAMMLAGAGSGFALYWIGTGGNALWSNGNNWSLYSGGGAAETSPGAGDVAIFDLGSGAFRNITVDAEIAAPGVTIQITNVTGGISITVDALLTLAADTSVDLTTAANSLAFYFGAGSIALAGNATFDVASGTEVSSSETINNAGGNLTFKGDGNFNFSGVISGSNQVIKEGSGTLKLTGNNAFTGIVTLSAGTLLINGTHTNAATGDITVASGATLGGTGTIKSHVIVNGTVKPGDPSVASGVGTLTTSTAGGEGNVTFNPGSYLTVDNNNTSYDVLAVGGTLSLQTDNTAFITLETGESYSTSNKVVTAVTYDIAKKFKTTSLPVNWSITQTADSGVWLTYTNLIIPTLNEWGIIIMLLLLTGTGILVMRKRQYTGGVA